MNLEEALNYRRAVRVFDRNRPIDPEKVKHCLELAALAPSSSNMQLWECYHITQPDLMARISVGESRPDGNGNGFGDRHFRNPPGFVSAACEIRPRLRAGETLPATARKSVRPNASKTGSCTTEN